MGHFDWHTEEEGPTARATLYSAVPRRRRWLGPLVIAGLLGLFGLVFWQLNRQASLRDRVVRDDILAAFNLWTKAVNEKDADLFETLLVRSETDWRTTQKRLLKAGLLLQRDNLGLTLAQGGGLSVVQPKIDLDGDLREAEITFPVIYEVGKNESPARQVSLVQTVLLSWDGSRWLQRRPEDTFWGEWRAEAGQLVNITFRARDEEIAVRLLGDLERDMKRLCSGYTPNGQCPAGKALAIRLESENQVLFRYSARETPAFLGRTFVLPSPTLVGMPFDEGGYQALYQGYTVPVLATFEAALSSPILLPEQVVAMLCFNHEGSVPRLFSYDPAADVWRNQLDNRAFTFIAADENDDRLVLREALPQQPNRLRLIQWTGTESKLRHDSIYGSLTDHQVGWSGRIGQPSLWLASYRGTVRNPSYGLAKKDYDDRSGCPLAGCGFQMMDGFPAWSPDGTQSLLVLDGQVYRGNGDGHALTRLSEGFSPFWLDDQRYGFARLWSHGGQQATELVSGVVGEDTLRPFWRTDAFNPEAIKGAADNPVFIQHVEVLYGEPRRLIMYGRQYAGEASSYVFASLVIQPSRDNSLEAPTTGLLDVELILDNPPARIPSTGDPNGHVPFVTSPDGRWLSVGSLEDKQKGAWIIYLKELGGNRLVRYSTQYPGYSFSHPFFDWSLDSRWVLIVDENSLRLVAPEYGYERFIAHDLHSCSYPTWFNLTESR